MSGASSCSNALRKEEAIEPMFQPLVHNMKSYQAPHLGRCPFIRASILLSLRAGGGGMGHALDSGRHDQFSLLLQQPLPLDLVACRTAALSPAAGPDRSAAPSKMQ